MPWGLCQALISLLAIARTRVCAPRKKIKTPQGTSSVKKMCPAHCTRLDCCDHPASSPDEAQTIVPCLQLFAVCKRFELRSFTFRRMQHAERVSAIRPDQQKRVLSLGDVGERLLHIGDRIGLVAVHADDHVAGTE